MKNYQFTPLPLIVLFVACLFFTGEANSQWSTDPAINNAVCTDYYNQNQIQMIGDGSGGAIIAWVDYRFQPDYTIFAQLINSNGNTQWAANGIQVSSSAVNNERPSLTSDGNGGAIITWVTSGDFGNLYAQHVNASGTLLWDSNGAIICSTTVSNQAIPTITSDGNGGGIITWSDSRNNVNVHDDDVYAQRIDASGVVQWPVNGMAVTNISGTQGPSLQISGDGNGGAIIVWEDTRTGTNVAIFAQKINASGASQWDTIGVQVNSVDGGSLDPQLVSDAGGAIISWVDRRNGNSDMNIYAQKISSGGTVQWAINGVGVCLTTGNQNSPRLTSDGNGGAIITWNELGFGLPDPSVYAQRINASGIIQWASDGVGVCLATGQQGLSQLTSDGNGGAYITWQDARTNNIQDIYAQRIDSSGTSSWTSNGVAVSTATFVQVYPLIINDGNNGMIIAWTDYRNDLSGQRNDIYAQRVNSDGSLGSATGADDNDNSLPMTVNLSQNYPNPFNPQTTIQYSLPEQSLVSIDIFDILGRKIETLTEGIKAAGNHQMKWDGSAQASGIYFYRIKAGDKVETKKMLLVK